MRPIRLTMAAFGPYAGKEILDFQALGESTLFLICGPTGAGKSTILDAMCYALYGKTSGGMRSGGSLRSDYAGPDTLTEVVFDFAIGEKRYRITRIPEQMRLKKRSKDPTAMALQKMESALYEIDEDGKDTRLLTAKNTEKMAAELLGVDVDQFRQIILLPQGDFRRLLLADSQDRERIMESLFHTDVYKLLERKLFGEVSALAKTYNAGKQQIEGMLRSGEAETVEALAARAAEAGEKGQAAGALYAERNKAHQSFQKRYDEAQLLISSWDRLRKAQAGAEALAAKAKDMEALDAHVQRIAAAARLQDAKAQLSDTLEKGKKRSHDWKAVSEALGKEKEKLSAAEKAWAAYETGAKAQEERQARLVTLRQLIEPAAQYGKAKGETERRTRDWEAAKLQEERAGKRLGALREAAEQAKKAAFSMEAVFMETQAAYLARDLTEGMPCPVCGATHHPSKAHSDKPIPEKHDVDLAKERAARAEQDERKAQEAWQNAQKEEAEAKAKLSAAKATLDQICQQVSEEYRDGRALAGAIRQLEGECQAFEEGKKAADAARQALAESVSALGTEEALLEKQVHQLREQYKADKEVLLARALGEGFKDLDELDQYFQDISHENEYRKTLTDYAAAVKAEADAAAAETKAIGGREEPDRKQWEEDRKASDETVKAALTEKTRWESEEKRLRHIEAAIHKVEESNKDVGTRYKLAGRLYNLFSGQANGINLERFVLGALLDDVTRKANIRLKVMSGGRYELSRKMGRDDARKKGGLDLEVFDSYTGQARPANTLSGGETFLASLSLALGLADVVQEYAGGIHLDAMFIDEGFGTLDSESLDLALKTLTKLQTQTRLVGIISHVAELEERIPAKLRVTKTDVGSRAEFEIN